MRLVRKPAALIDRNAIYDFIDADNPVAAADMDMLFKQKTRLLADNPDMGRKGRVHGTRELIAHPNYILVYRRSETV